MDFDDMNKEQMYNKEMDKIHLLKIQQKIDREREQERSGIDCDFETNCTWTWRKDIAHGFFITSANKLEPNVTNIHADASNNIHGKYTFRYCPSAKMCFSFDSLHYGGIFMR